MKYDIVTTISYPKKGAMGKTGSWRVFKPVLDKTNKARKSEIGVRARGI